MKYKLEPLDLTRLNYAESSKFVDRQLTEAGSLPPAMGDGSAMYQKYLSGLSTRYDAMHRALNQVTESAESKRMVAADRERDLAIRLYDRSLALHEHFDVAAERDAFVELNILNKKYKGIELLNYEKQTEQADKMVLDLERAPYASHVATLALTRQLARVKTSNKAFETLFTKRENDAIAKETFETRILCKELMDYYREFALFVQTMANADEGGYFAQVLDAINMGRKYYADLLAHRVGTSNAEKEKRQNTTLVD